MKVVINVCYGGFGLSKEAIKCIAKLQGRKAYFFNHCGDDKGYEPVCVEDKGVFWTAFDVPNPNEVLTDNTNWYEMSMEEKIAHDKVFEDHVLDSRYAYEKRNDPLLLKVVKSLGSKRASGLFGELKIVTIPDDVEWTIEKYGGNEWVAEKHRTWS